MQKWLTGLQHRLIHSKVIFLIIGAMVNVMAIAVPTIQYDFTQVDKIKSAQRELHWATYIRPLIPLMQLLQSHELNLFLARHGSKVASRRLVQITERINRRINRFNPIDPKLSPNLFTNFEWNIFTHDWHNLMANRAHLSASDLRRRYASLLTNLWTTIVHSTDAAKVNSRTNPANRYQIDVLGMQIPTMLVQLSLLENLLLKIHPNEGLSSAQSREWRQTIGHLNASVFTTRSDLVHALALKHNLPHNFTSRLDHLVLDIHVLRSLYRQFGAQTLARPRQAPLLQDISKTARDARSVFSTCARNQAYSSRQRITALLWHFYISIVITMVLSASALVLFILLYRSMQSAITERLSAEERLLRASDLYAALSQTNELIARHCEPDTLFAQVCAITVDHGGLALALIAEKNPMTGEVAISAACGDLREHLRDFLDTSQPDRFSSANPIIRAFSLDQPVVLNHLKSISDADMAASFGTMGLNSGAAFPLYRNGKIAGVLAVYALAESFFDTQFTGLLIEMAHGISFALDDIEREKHRRSAEQALRNSELRYQLILENAGDAIILLNEDGHILDFNRRAAEQFGYTRPEMMDMCGEVLFSKETQLEDRQRRKTILDGGQTLNATVTAVRKDGTCFPVELTESRVVFQDRPMLLGIFRDISERKLAEDRIKYLAYHDALTDLPNRMLLHDRLGQTIRHARRNNTLVGVIFLDLDNFKSVNDTLGHDRGDELLKLAAQRIKSSLREGDTVARMGGDEFVVLLPKVPQESDVNHVANKILKSMNVPFIIAGQTFHITCSIGTSLFPHDGSNEIELLRTADDALYRAKKDGRNCVILHSPELHTAAAETLWMENDLRQAVTRNQLCLHYQPQVDLNSGCIIGAEALVRWQHPTRGLISPAKFIPLAEERGLMPVLGEWILKTACHQIRLWKDAGLPVVPVAVNVSALQFREASLPEVVHRVLKESGIDPRLLMLEITEGTLMTQVNVLRNHMVEIKKNDIRFSLDDFGTGYSSLSYLTRFPIDTLKIDISFVRNMMDDPKDLAVVDTIIELADNLQLRTVAEGVEKTEQVMLLKLLGCHAMQGFFFSKPLDSDDFAQILLTDKRLYHTESPTGVPLQDDSVQ